MTLDSSNHHMFFAYHIRSAFLKSESVLQEVLAGWNLSLDHFYVLRCNWNAEGVSLDEITAHSMLTRQDVSQALTDLITKNCVSKGAKDGFYSLSPQGSMLRNQTLEAYQVYIAKLTDGLSDKVIETALSSLLTVQNNIQQK